MSKRLNFIMVMHNHQPAGNFGHIFLKAFNEAYKPFLETLSQHPGIKLALHYSGSLIDWLKDNQPDFLKTIKSLVKKGQVEIIGGGYYEPILPLVPFADALGQIRLLTDKIKDLFGFTAHGAWTTERVWEPKMPQILASAGINYTFLDDTHFSNAGYNPEELNGFYLSEEQGRSVGIFPTSEKLRYTMPFKLPQETIEYLRKRLENADSDTTTITFGDDGEKFGLWPGTAKWVYTEGWLENFFSALEENSDWITTLLPSEYFKNNKPQGIVYLPCASYREMLEWSGGFYRNFFVRYPESRNMYKRMFYVSNKLQEIKPKTPAPKLNNALRHLYMAQANDAYWHGVFGGLYLGYLRSSIYSNLILAEGLIDNYKKCLPSIEELDFDDDARKELIIKTKDAVLVLRPQQGGTFSEWSDKEKNVNLTNTLSRRKEPYHKKLMDKLSSQNVDVISEVQPLSIHNIEKVKEAGLENLLFYDKFDRYCLLDHFLDRNLSLDDFVKNNYSENGDFITNHFQSKIDRKALEFTLSRQGSVHSTPLNLIKRLSVKDRSLILDYQLRNLSEECLSYLFGVEFNFSIWDDSFCRQPGIMKGFKNLELKDSWSKINLAFEFNQETGLWYFPVETVSDSESGIEKNYQELCLLFWWPLDLRPQEEFKVDFTINLNA